MKSIPSKKCSTKNLTRACLVKITNGKKQDSNNNETKTVDNYARAFKIFCKLTPELRAQRVTRSITKKVNDCSNFVIYEDYRCMLLLGDEHQVPNWEVHAVKYSIVFVDDKRL